jgi:hypothetical protein
MRAAEVDASKHKYQRERFSEGSTNTWRGNMRAYRCAVLWVAASVKLSVEVSALASDYD